MSQNQSIVSLSQAKPPFFVGVDLNTRRVQASVIDDAGQVLSRTSHLFEPGQKTADIVGLVEKTALAAIQLPGLQPSAIAGVGIGLPGLWEPASKKWIDMEDRLGAWNGFPFSERLGACCGLPTHLFNDTMAAAFGESWVGAGSKLPSLILFHLDDSMTCGVVYGERSIDGKSNYGIESCHMIIDIADDAALCTCGQRGHLAAYVSVATLLANAKKALESGRESSIAQRIQQGQKLTLELIGQEATAGDALAKTLVSDAARYLGIGIVNQMNTMDPDGFLLSGPMTFGGMKTQLGRQFLQWIKEEVARRAFAALIDVVVIEYASLGDDAVCVGAAGLARSNGKK